MNVGDGSTRHLNRRPLSLGELRVELFSKSLKARQNSTFLLLGTIRRLARLRFLRQISTHSLAWE